VLILSRFAGAARQLPDALLVNPHDPDAMADAMDTALRMDIGERQERWNRLWAAIENRTPALWGRSFLAALMRTTLPVPKARPVAAIAPVESMAAAPLPSGPPRLTLVENDVVPQRRLN
jgi:trehalose 6-phosphate synthase